jgi:hypothetical protein
MKPEDPRNARLHLSCGSECFTGFGRSFRVWRPHWIETYCISDDLIALHITKAQDAPANALGVPVGLRLTRADAEALRDRLTALLEGEKSERTQQ